MKTKFGIVGCGFLGNIVADAWKKGLLEDYELVGVTSRTFASAEKTAASVGCAACADVDALLALEPEYIVEAASVEAVRAMAVPVLRRGVSLVVLSIGAFADLAFYEEVKQAAREGGPRCIWPAVPSAASTYCRPSPSWLRLRSWTKRPVSRPTPARRASATPPSGPTIC